MTMTRHPLGIGAYTNQDGLAARHILSPESGGHGAAYCGLDPLAGWRNMNDLLTLDWLPRRYCTSCVEKARTAAGTTSA
ncbi:MAG: hypothetical protein ACYC2H_00515 [Thermoplasmatota archaeon]